MRSAERGIESEPPYVGCYGSGRETMVRQPPTLAVVRIPRFKTASPYLPKLFVEHNGGNDEADGGDDPADTPLRDALGVVGAEEITRHGAGGHHERFWPVQ